MIEETPVEPHFDDDFALEIVHELRSAAEIARAVEHARTCEECDHRLRFAAADRERFRARSEGVLAAFAGARPARARRRGALAVVLATAAAVTIVSGIVFLRAPAPRTQLALLGLPAPLEIVHLRSREESADLPRLEDAIARYGQGDWAGARKGLETPFADRRFEPLRRLYLASALLELGHTAEARVELDEIGSIALPDPYSDWRDWARLRTSPKTIDAGRADSVVRVLAGRPGLLQDKAQRLIDGESETPAQVPQ